MDKEAIKEAVREAFKEELKAFYIDRETHYKQHEWLGEMIQYCDQCKSVVWKTVVTIFVGGAIACMVAGFIFKSGWSK